jgi:hypothetical protein
MPCRKINDNCWSLELLQSQAAQIVGKLAKLSGNSLDSNMGSVPLYDELTMIFSNILQIARTNETLNVVLVPKTF